MNKHEHITAVSTNQNDSLNFIFLFTRIIYIAQFPDLGSFAVMINWKIKYIVTLKIFIIEIEHIRLPRGRTVGEVIT